MKQKAKYYNNSFPVDTMRKWLKYKDYHYIVWKGHCTIKELFDIKLQPKRRHQRSISIRNLKRLYKRTLYELDWSKRSFQEMNFRIPYANNCEWVKKHRIYV